MARGGINRAVVKIARDALLARGLKPTIDGIRIELGNTGSKSTIIRCLRELAEAETHRPSLSLEEELTTLIGSVAERVREDAQASIATERELLTRQELEHRVQRRQAQEKIAELLQINAELVVQLKDQRSLELQLQESLRSSEAERGRLVAIEEALKLLSEEHASQIESLEEKHLHARQVLEHYRAAQKEQRDQQINHHDQELTHIRHEMRTLQATLMTKQDEISTLNRDNERLIQQVQNLTQQVTNWESEIRAQRNKFIEELSILRVENTNIHQQLESTRRENVVLHERLRQRLSQVRSFQRLLQRKHSRDTAVSRDDKESAAP